MKKIKIFLMMLLAVLSFTACDDDDDSKQSIISEYSMNDQQVAAQKAKSGKDKAVLLVAFGSTWTNAFAAFDDTKKAYEDAFPDADVYFCFSSDICINRASAGEHGESRNYYEPRYLLHAIGAAKYKTVYVQSLQVIPGEEFANVVAAVKKSMSREKGGMFDVYNVSNCRKIHVEDIVNYIECHLPFPVTHEYVDGTPGDQMGVYGANALVELTMEQANAAIDILNEKLRRQEERNASKG